MNKIINTKDIVNLTKKLRLKKLSIVLVGGCFDILHIGHIKFLKKAKKMGDRLLVLLESDEKVRKLKGKNRPFFSQKERAEMLSSLQFIDFVLLLPTMKDDQAYEDLIRKIKPAIIAVTSGDLFLEKKKAQARIVKGKLEIITYLRTPSTSKLANLLGID
jgi:rfaE bifunctional protein nucleotidyltransferase chain/domain